MGAAQERFWAWLRTNPHLANLNGVVHEDPLALDAYAATNLPGSGQRALLRFALAVWNDGVEWDSGTFRLDDLRSLDHHGLEWVAAWVEDPRWP